MRTLVIVSGALLSFTTARVSACDRKPALPDLARRVIDDRGAEEALVALRAAGPTGLTALLGASDRALLSREDRARVDGAIDRVAGQRYGHVSRLFWYTDLEAAKLAAKASGRRILSLRLLGDLTEELSCANSRFFRTVLYVHPEISKVLAGDFVLHWSSERAPPVITIDFGDGRKLRRTVTGNSVHYVLDAKGRVIDAIPGLYSPADFLVQLNSAQPEVSHRSRMDMIAMRWSSDLSRIGVDLAGRDRVPAKDAMFLAVGKARVEAPMIMSALELAQATSDQSWDRLAATRPAVFAEETKRIIARENPSLDASAVDAMLARFAQSVARDSLQNELMLHHRIHERLAGAPLPAMRDFNRWVYAEVFATPATDPWLGLHEDTAYTGLEDAGIIGVQR